MQGKVTKFLERACLSCFTKLLWIMQCHPVTLDHLCHQVTLAYMVSSSDPSSSHITLLSRTSCLYHQVTPYNPKYPRNERLFHVNQSAQILQLHQNHLVSRSFPRTYCVIEELLTVLFHLLCQDNVKSPRDLRSSISPNVPKQCYKVTLGHSGSTRNPEIKFCIYEVSHSARDLIWWVAALGLLPWPFGSWKILYGLTTVQSAYDALAPSCWLALESHALQPFKAHPFLLVPASLQVYCLSHVRYVCLILVDDPSLDIRFCLLDFPCTRNTCC